MSKRLVLMLMMMLLVTTNAYALNKWVDDQGKVHYSDQPPPGHVKAKPLSLDSSAPAAVTTTSASGVSGVPASKDNSGDAAKAAAAKKAAADKAALDASNNEIKKANCAGAKQNLANLKDGMRVATINPTTGERAYMDDAQRARSIDDAQQQISKNCQ